jgi:hypothetical protein
MHRACAVLYCLLSPLCLHNISAHVIYDFFFFRKKYLFEIKCVFWFSLQLLADTSVILRTIPQGEGKVHHTAGHEGTEGKQRYSYTLSLTSALGGVGGHPRATAALHPGKIRYPLYRRVGGPQGRSGQVRKISPPMGFDPRTVQLGASRYTDWAIEVLS